MSVDINWDTFTSGPDGQALAERIREFMHDKFQQITLPRFINSVHVHSFDFGRVCPEIEIKDVCDPLPDFYEDEESEGDDDEEDSSGIQQDAHADTAVDRGLNEGRLNSLQAQILRADGRSGTSTTEVTGAARNHSKSSAVPLADTRTLPQYGFGDHFGPLFHRSGTAGIPGGTSNLSYFHLPMGGLSGTQTPLAAVASGTQFSVNAWQQDVPLAGHQHSALGLNPSLQQDLDGAGRLPRQQPPPRPSTASTHVSAPEIDSPANPGSPEQPRPVKYISVDKVSEDLKIEPLSSPSPPLRPHPGQPTDLQVVSHVRYVGDVRMTLTAEILLDYPMPSFVGIPLKLSITGMTFDGVAIIAYIKRRMHFCFLSPEDADALVGDQVAEEGGEKSRPSARDAKKTMGGLLQEIRVESEIGRKENGKQSLKNVGKVEKFVLEQVRRIFEEEFVFPSFWTFLV